jgi:predicted component of viral defense system (DUF524 family)
MLQPVQPAADSEALRLSSRRAEDPEPEMLPEGRGWKLNAECCWKLEGTPAQLRAVHRALGSQVCELVTERVALLRFGNSVGRYDGGLLGELVVTTGKFSEADYDAMLRAIARQSAALPFSVSTPSALPYDRTLVTDDVLYHQFVYLRHVVLEDSDDEAALLPALRAVLHQPHRKLVRERRVVALELASSFDTRSLLDVARGLRPMIRASGAVARRLGGYLPVEVEEPVARSTFDTPENRFVKNFLGVCARVSERMRAECQDTRPGRGPFASGIRRDCDEIDRRLKPIRTHPLWREVGRMELFPAASTVLQGRFAYRTVFDHYNRIRLAARALPLDTREVRRLLEVKDIAALYEIWCFFEIVRLVAVVRGARPSAADRLQVDPLQVGVGWGLRVTWSDMTSVTYNEWFPSRRGSYSVGLRPDIVLRVPSGPGQGLHLLDAKFKVSWAQLAGDEDEGDEERRGVFKHGDLYKMHTYRDAIRDVRSVWVLYPGTEARFFSASRGPLGEPSVFCCLDGVGALPLGLSESTACVRQLGTLLGVAT